MESKGTVLMAGKVVVKHQGRWTALGNSWVGMGGEKWDGEEEEPEAWQGQEEMDLGLATFTRSYLQFSKLTHPLVLLRAAPAE